MKRMLLAAIVLSIVLPLSLSAGRQSHGSTERHLSNPVPGDSLSIDSLSSAESEYNASRSRPPFMVMIGIAFADSTPHSPLFRASLAYRRGDFIVGGRLTRGAEGFWEPDLLSLLGLDDMGFDEIEERPTPGLWELGLTAGFCIGRRTMFMTVSAGIGWLSYVERGAYLGQRCDEDYTTGVADCYEQYESLSNSRVGLAIETNFVYSFNDHGGIGLNLFANINGDLPFYGAGLALIGGLTPP